MQDFVESYNIVKPYVPSVTLLLLQKKEVEQETSDKDPWAETKPIKNVTNCHVSHCRITGQITVWSLPGGNKLAVINYGDVGSCSNDSTTTYLAQSLLVSKDDPVTPPCDGDVNPIKVGCWNLVSSLLMG